LLVPPLIIVHGNTVFLLIVEAPFLC